MHVTCRSRGLAIENPHKFDPHSRAGSHLRAARRRSRDGGSTCPSCRRLRESTAAPARGAVAAGEAGAGEWPKRAAAALIRACQRNTAGPTVVRRTIGAEIRKGESESIGSKVLQICSREKFDMVPFCVVNGHCCQNSERTDQSACIKIAHC